MLEPPSSLHSLTSCVLDSCGAVLDSCGAVPSPPSAPLSRGASGPAPLLLSSNLPRRMFVWAAGSHSHTPYACSIRTERCRRRRYALGCWRRLPSIVGALCGGKPRHAPACCGAPAARRGPNGPDADHGPLRPLADWCCSRSCRVARTKISQPTRTLAPARRVPSHHRQPENALTVYIFMKKYMHSHSPFLIARALYALGVRPGTLGYVSACIGMSTNTQRAVGRPDGGRKCCRPPSTVRRAHSTPTKDTTHRRPSRPVAGPAGPRFDGRCCPVDAVTC